jgi:hypothetical protein
VTALDEGVGEVGADEASDAGDEVGGQDDELIVSSYRSSSLWEPRRTRSRVSSSGFW